MGSNMLMSPARDMQQHEKETYHYCSPSLCPQRPQHSPLHKEIRQKHQRWDFCDRRHHQRPLKEKRNEIRRHVQWTFSIWAVCPLSGKQSHRWTLGPLNGKQRVLMCAHQGRDTKGGLKTMLPVGLHRKTGIGTHKNKAIWKRS